MGVWGDEVFENDYALDWLAIFGYRIESIVRSTVYGMKTQPNDYYNEFYDGLVIPLYIYWIIINKVTEFEIAPPEFIQLQHWENDFKHWATNVISDEMCETNKIVLDFSAKLLERLLVHAHDFEDDNFDTHNREIDIDYLPVFERKKVDHFDQTGYLLYELFESLEQFVQSSFYEITLHYETGDWKSSPTTDSVFMGAVKVMYLISRYCRYAPDADMLTTQHFLFEPPRAYILKQWKTAYRRYVKKYFTKEEIKTSNYCQVRINLFDEYIRLAQEYEQLEKAEIEARRKGDKK